MRRTNGIFDRIKSVEVIDSIHHLPRSFAHQSCQEKHLCRHQHRKFQGSDHISWWSIQLYVCVHYCTFNCPPFISTKYVKIYFTSYDTASFCDASSFNSVYANREIDRWSFYIIYLTNACFCTDKLWEASRAKRTLSSALTPSLLLFNFSNRETSFKKLSQRTSGQASAKWLQPFTL